MCLHNLINILKTAAGIQCEFQLQFFIMIDSFGYSIFEKELIFIEKYEFLLAVWHI